MAYPGLSPTALRTRITLLAQRSATYDPGEDRKYLNNMLRMRQPYRKGRRKPLLTAPVCSEEREVDVGQDVLMDCAECLTGEELEFLAQRMLDVD
jgi:hypothetical protein